MYAIRSYYAHILAWSVVTMLTHQWLINDIGIFNITIIIAVNAQPCHFMMTAHLFLSNYRHVVLRHTGNSTCSAPDTRIQIDVHTPVMAAVESLRIIRIERLVIQMLMFQALFV